MEYPIISNQEEKGGEREMSRSYKHTPRCGDKKSRIAKRYANHVVRRKKLREDLPSYSGYKKLIEDEKALGKKRIINIEANRDPEEVWKDIKKALDERINI